MRHLYIIATLLLFAGVSSFGYYSPAPKKAGVYDRDSVLATMADYRQALVNIKNYKTQIDTDLARINAVLEAKKQEFNRDSATWTPIFKELKRKQISDLNENAEAFKETAVAEEKKYNEASLTPVHERVNSTAATLAKKKGLDMVVDKQELNGYKVMHPDATILNVTAEMIKLVN